ncbi:MAG: ImmA/IrrE family metallo-endopeptidase [Lawsonella sp.]
MFDLEELAHSHGHNVTYRKLPAHYPNAYHSTKHKLIVVRAGLPRRQSRSLLAHEIGHLHYGHKRRTRKAEKQANRYAARLLIDPTKYREAEAAYGTNVNKLAYELDVTPVIVRAYRETAIHLKDEHKNETMNSSTPSSHSVRKP